MSASGISEFFGNFYEFARGFTLKLTPSKLTVRAESAVQPDEEEPAELIDPLDEVRQRCSKHGSCPTLGERLQTCNDRVNSRKKTEETCIEELFDYLHCVDHCVSKNLFEKLK